MQLIAIAKSNELLWGYYISSMATPQSAKKITSLILLREINNYFNPLTTELFSRKHWEKRVFVTLTIEEVK